MSAADLRKGLSLLVAIVMAYGSLCAAPAMARTVSVGVYQNHPGVLTDAQGKTQGFYIDLLEAMADEEQWDLRYVPGSWAEGLERLERQKLDLLVAIAFTDARAKRYDYNHETVFVNWGQLFTGTVDINALFDLQGKRLAGVQGDIYTNEFERLLKSFGVQHVLIELPDYEAVLRQLSEGKVDAGIVSRSYGLSNAKKFRVFKSPIVCCAVEIRYAAPKGKSARILQAIDEQLRHYKKNQGSIYYTSLGRWFGSVGTPRFPEWALWLLGGVGGLLMVFIGGTIFLKRQIQRQTRDLHLENAERKRVESKLRQSHDTLEQRVQERTKTLEKANQQLQSEIEERRRAQEVVHRLNTRNEMILNSVGEGIYGMDKEGNTIFFNPSATRMTGWLIEDLMGNNIHDMMHHTRSDGTPYPRDLCRIGLSMHEGHTLETDNEIFWRKDGTSFPVEYISSPIYEADILTGAVVVFRDITARWEEEAQRTRSLTSQVAIRALLETGLEPLSMERQLGVALDILLSVAWLGFLHQGSIFLMDDENEELVMVAQRGLSEELLQLCHRIKPGYCLCGRAALTKEIVYADALDHRHDIMFEGIREHGHYCAPILSQKGLLGVLNLYIPHGHPNNAEEDSFMTTVANTLAGLIERRRMEAQLQEVEKQLRHSAHHDALTGLPNRRYLMEMLNHSVARAKREQKHIAVIFMDLDKFKLVNDSLGHDMGDLLLKEASNRIQGCLRGSDILARLGGDEFMMILSTVSNKEEVGLVADRIVKSLQISFILDGKTCNIGSSLGIALFPEHGEESEVLVKHADLAMYTVKEHGRNHFRFFNPKMRQKKK